MITGFQTGVFREGFYCNLKKNIHTELTISNDLLRNAGFRLLKSNMNKYKFPDAQSSRNKYIVF